MEHLDLILPCMLVVIAFLLKLVVDRSVEASNTIQAIIELPVDIIFLALTFSVAYTLTKTENQADGLFYGFVGIAFAIIIVLIWKKAQNLLLKGSYWWILLLFINLGISVFAVKQSIDLVIRDESKKVECTNEVKQQ
jgi:chromate transport protein ChrA